ncbi:MAG TPA: EAL domain-containing protein, partial [Baekduia sp.]
DLAHNLGLTVVAEGVEDEDALSMLVEYGCDVAQGYFFSRPQPADALTAWLADSAYGATATA